MSETMLLLDRADDGVYEVPSQHVYPDEPLDTMADLIEPTKERARLRVGTKTVMVTIYVEDVAGIRYPYLSLEDMRKL